jgi:hypothetical protein
LDTFFTFDSTMNTLLSLSGRESHSKGVWEDLLDTCCEQMPDARSLIRQITVSCGGNAEAEQFCSATAIRRMKISFSPIYAR